MAGGNWVVRRAQSEFAPFPASFVANPPCLRGVKQKLRPEHEEALTEGATRLDDESTVRTHDAAGRCLPRSNCRSATDDLCRHHQPASDSIL